MTRIPKILALAALLLALPAQAQDKPCSAAEMSAAEKAADRIVNWGQLYQAWQTYRHCDKGVVEENFTDALLRLLVDWKQVDLLARPMEENKDFRAFVHKHLNSPAAKGDVDSVYSRAKLSCPKGLEKFCTDIATTAKPFAGMEMSIPSSAPAAPKK